MNGVDWFERIAGFVEGPYHWTQERLHVEDGHLISQRDGSRHRIGRFEMISLAALREMSSHTGRSDVQVRPVIGDARALHADATNAGATFQVATTDAPDRLIWWSNQVVQYAHSPAHPPR